MLAPPRGAADPATGRPVLVLRDEDDLSCGRVTRRDAGPTVVVMTTATALPTTGSPTTPLRAERSAGAGAGTVLAVGAGLSAAALVVALAGLVIDGRTISGAPAWLKPAKFSISICLYLLTLRWVIAQLPTGGSQRLRTGAVVVVGALCLELVVIDLQVLRGTTSHFNTSTALDGVLFEAMGGLISLVFVLTAVLAWRVLRTRSLDEGIAAGLRWGLGVCLLGMAAAGTMLANTGWDDGGGHTVGAPDGGPGLPLTDWSTAHGDLRIGHFLGLHALQLLPLLAVLLRSRTGLDARTRARVVTVAGLAQALVVVLLTWQALRGQALLQPDAPTLGVLAAIVAATGSALAVVLVPARAGTPGDQAQPGSSA